MDFVLHFAAFWISCLVFYWKFFFLIKCIWYIFRTSSSLLLQRFLYKLCFSSLSIGANISQGCRQSIQKQSCSKLCSAFKKGISFLQTIQVYYTRHHPLNTWWYMTEFTKFEHIKKGKYIWQKSPLLTKVYYIQSAYCWAKKSLLPRRLLQIRKR